MNTDIASRRIGDLRVFPIGMGAMTLTQTPEHDPEQAVEVVRAALNAGVTLFDTADAYGPTSEMGVNERALIGALRQIPSALDRAIVATKGGHTRGPRATWWIDGSPEHLATAARASRDRLGLDALPLYHHHRPDPRTPYAESMRGLKRLVDDGVVERVGLSNVSVGQIDLAQTILGDALVSVQNECSPVRLHELETLKKCEELDLAFLAWSPLGGMRAAKEQSAGNEALAGVATARGESPQRVALAWLLTLSPVMIPIPGASKPASIIDSAQAAATSFTAEEQAWLDEALLPTDFERVAYPEASQA